MKLRAFKSRLIVRLRQFLRGSQPLAQIIRAITKLVDNCFIYFDSLLTEEDRDMINSPQYWQLLGIGLALTFLLVSLLKALDLLRRW
jgi:hypothetical protein